MIKLIFENAYYTQARKEHMFHTYPTVGILDLVSKLRASIFFTQVHSLTVMYERTCDLNATLPGNDGFNKVMLTKSLGLLG
mmetsp:Transcript_32161/g.58952  ORF Transcript_32161/g.58952 Transcript_32161/m.58952 type:complete len:81 (+) Transcript_32161:1005-1247(+)